MKIRLIIVVQHTTKVVVKKNSSLNWGFEPKLCVWSFKYSLELIIIYYPGCQRLFLVGGDRIEQRSQVAKKREKNITNS